MRLDRTHINLNLSINRLRSRSIPKRSLVSQVDPVLGVVPLEVPSNYTAYRNNAAEPSVCLMYRKNQDGYSILKIYGLPYRFIRMLLHGDYNYKNIDELFPIMNMQLYNRRIVALGPDRLSSLSPTNIPNYEGVFQILKRAAIYIRTNDLPANFHTMPDESKEEILMRYRVVFLYDNVDDYNSYLFIRFLRFTNSAPSWTELVLYPYWLSNVINSPFTTSYSVGSQGIAPNMLYSYTGTYNPPSAHFVSNEPSVNLHYQYMHGLMTFFCDNTHPGNTIGELLSNVSFNGTATQNEFLCSILIYKDYTEDVVNGYADEHILGFGFVTRASDDTVRVSTYDSTLGRTTITNTHGILHEHTMLTAFLRFMVLYCPTDNASWSYDVLAYLNYMDGVETSTTSMKLEPERKSRIYYDMSSTNNGLLHVARVLQDTEHDGFKLIARNISGVTRFYIVYNLSQEEEHELKFDNVEEFRMLLDEISEQRINLIYGVQSLGAIVQEYLRQRLSASNTTTYTWAINLNELMPYYSDPMFLSSNQLDEPHYIEYLSHYYPRYWFYDASGNRVPNINISSVPIASVYLESSHPAVLIYRNLNVEYPVTKRGVRSRRIHYNIQTNTGDPPHYYRRCITYLTIYDPVQLDTTIWNNLLLTQDQLTLPIDLGLLNENQPIVKPPVLCEDYMITPVERFIGGSLVSSGDILLYPRIPNTPISEIDPNKGIYYAEVLYWKYIRYLINAALIAAYTKSPLNIGGPDIIEFSIKRTESHTEVINNVAQIVPRVDVVLRIKVFDNRHIDNVEINMHIT